MSNGSVYVGTSGWSYANWVGRFYPQDLRAQDRFAFYRRHFNTVEINLSFYRLPTQNTLDAWNRALPADFHLVLKGSRVITHVKRLSDCGEALARFWERAGQLRTLRAVLWQLPPNFRQDLERLERFLSGLPTRVRHAVEFRHESWWNDRTARVLEKHGAAFVAVSTSQLPDTIYPTADFLYVRFHGPARSPVPGNYTREELARWAARLRPWVRRGRTLYAFFNNDYRAYAVRNADTLLSLLPAPDSRLTDSGIGTFPAFPPGSV